MTIMEANVAVPDERKNQQQQPGRAPRHHNGRWSGFRHLFWIRLLELKREPEVVFWAFVFPLLVAVGLGVAFRTKPADVVSVVVIDGVGAQKTVATLERASIKNLTDNNDAYKKPAIRATVLDRVAALSAIQFGKSDLAIESNRDGSYTYYYDPARTESMVSHAEIDATLQSAAGRQDALPTSSQPASEPGSRYIDFLVPGLLGMKLASSGMWGVALALIELRQRKLLKRFGATPMRRSDFLLALASSRLTIMVLEAALLLGFGVLIFHVPVQGSILTIILMASVGGLAFGAVGLLTACRAQKLESVSGLINLIAMPMWIFSGVFFSYQKFPAIAQLFIKVLPLTALNDALRATIIEGASLGSQSVRLLVLAVWGSVLFVIALRWFRWS